jgi:uncharacterized protein (TIGR02145 family)
MKNPIFCILLITAVFSLAAQDIANSFQPAETGVLTASISVTKLWTSDQAVLAENETPFQNGPKTANPPLQTDIGTGYLYPNPCNGEATLLFSTTLTGTTEIMILNSSGQLLTRETTTLDPGMHNFSVKLPMTGNYYISVLKKNETPLNFKAISTGEGSGICDISYNGTEQVYFSVAFSSGLAITLPTVITDTMTNITQTSATGGGNVTNDGITRVKARGVCWNITGNPSISNSKTTNGNGTGSFTSNLTGLTAGTTYYVRAYATNSLGTAYGNQVSFTTLANGGNTVTDVDGNVYPVISIGTQIWMAENLKTTKYRDGVAIPNIVDDSGWAGLTTGAYSWYNNDEATYKNKYGGLYNWYAVVDSHNLCPVGWHVPTNADWSALETYLITNGYNFDGSISLNKIAKSVASTSNWISSAIKGSPGKDPSTNNSSGFNGLPAGGRAYNGSPIANGYYGLWWSSTTYSATDGMGRMLYNEDIDFYGSYFNKLNGFSVRCIKD